MPGGKGWGEWEWERMCVWERCNLDTGIIFLKKSNSRVFSSLKPCEIQSARRWAGCSQYGESRTKGRSWLPDKFKWGFFSSPFIFKRYKLQKSKAQTFPRRQAQYPSNFLDAVGFNFHLLVFYKYLWQGKRLENLLGEFGKGTYNLYGIMFELSDPPCPELESCHVC